MILWGDTGRVRIGTLKTLNITPYVNEQNVTSTALPTGASASSLPATPLATFTLSPSSVAPTFSGNVNVKSYTTSYGFAFSCQNTSGATQTVYYQINKNGTSWKTGNTSVANSYYVTLTLMDALVVKTGDKLDFYMWSPASSGVNWIYQAQYAQPTRIITGANFIYNVNYSVSAFENGTYFPLTGKSGLGAQGNVYIVNNPMTTTAYTNTSGTTTVNILQINPTYGLFDVQAGAYAGTYNDIRANATSYPVLDGNYQVTSVSYRDLFF